ncbi:hypothetical protein J4460_01440 [Candidatus Woesearchaeota archaeon]|nr:MAG: transcription regulator [archaeon GW2011_AR4]MBS3129314.1 hypothetical protein [Candidatus Woesearchaeota archaeon]HIH38617.1 hypothetical protein [Candidatus Woesearchaeota archaeon]HIH49444.1 hypothetical protein [Candidatus Woesearchaeota archaeon]HIJ02821.1 hypothetical protein [Candidatus Woesearchaeota archaeon]
MKRKVVKLGPTTLVVSLPSKWVSGLKISPGDEITVEESGSALLLSKEGSITPKETTISLTRLTESAIRTAITNAYRKGFDKVFVKYQNEKQFSILAKVIKTRLIGYDITKKEQGSCIIENLTEPSLDQFDKIVQKYLHTISVLLEESTEALKYGKTVGYEDAIEAIQQYDNFCKRVIAKRKVTMPESEFYWTFLTLTTHGAREIYHLHKGMQKQKGKVAKETIKVMESCSALFALLKKCYLKREIALLDDVHEMEKTVIYKQGYAALQKKDAVVVHHVLAAARNFYLAASPLLGILLGEQD